MLHLSKYIAVILFTLTPILAGITSGLMMNNTLFWSWIVLGLTCLAWFVTAVIMTNRMKPAMVVSMPHPAPQQI